MSLNVVVKSLLSAILVFGISDQAAAKLVLDLDLAPGDQGKREETVKPGQRVKVELVALEGALGNHRRRGPDQVQPGKGQIQTL